MSPRIPDPFGANPSAELIDSHKLSSQPEFQPTSHLASHHDTCAVSWGVESEFVLAFHRDRLRRILSFFGDAHRPAVVSEDDIDHRKILQQMTKQLDFIQAYNLRKRWPSSLLAATDKDQPVMAGARRSDVFDDTLIPWFHYMVEDTQMRAKYDGRMYHRSFALEPLLVAQDILHRSRIPLRPIGFRISDDSVGWRLTVNEARDGDDRLLLYPGLVHPEIMVSNKRMLYDTWILTRDLSVTPAEKSELRSKFGLLDEEAKSWESDGVELISPKFDRIEIDKGFREMTKMLDALKYEKFERKSASMSDAVGFFQGLQEQYTKVDENDQSAFSGGYGTLESVFAGTHVHIGLDLSKRPNQSLLIIKHIAFIILANETLISSLHPYHRRGLAKAVVSPLSDVFPPNKRARTASGEKRYQIEAEEIRMTEFREKYLTTINLGSNRQWFMKWYYRKLTLAPDDPAALDDLEYDQLADQLLDPRTTAEYFFDRIQSQRLGGKKLIMQHGSIVDFSRVAKNMGMDTDHKFTPPCTIEFRQHTCTLDTKEVKHWVKFLFALVDLAERRALQTTDCQGNLLSDQSEERDKYDGPIRSVEELCGPKNLNLPPDEIEYWVSRRERYALDAQDYQLKTTIRRRKRALDKARHQVELKEKDREYMPRRSYRHLSHDSLLKQVQENLNLEEGHEPDKPRLDVLAKKTHSELMDLAMQMEIYLVETGYYAPKQHLDPDGLPNVNPRSTSR